MEILIKTCCRCNFRTYEAAYKYCPRDGTELKPETCICNRCENRIYLHYSYCPYCGANTEE